MFCASPPHRRLSPYLCIVPQHSAVERELYAERRCMVVDVRDNMNVVLFFRTLVNSSSWTVHGYKGSYIPSSPRYVPGFYIAHVFRHYLVIRESIALL